MTLLANYLHDGVRVVLIGLHLVLMCVCVYGFVYIAVLILFRESDNVGDACEILALICRLCAQEPHA